MKLSAIRKWDWETIGFILLMKLLLFTYATQSVATAAEDSGGWLQIWQRWDAVHYVAIAERGYAASGPDRVLLAFFPLYPFVVRATAFLTRDVLAAAFVVSGLASIAVGLLLKRLVRLDEPSLIARRAVWFLFIFPTSFFLHIAYTESLFLVLVLGCFFAARTDRWGLAGTLGAAACLTRLNGLLLAPALAVEAFAQMWSRRQMHWRWMWIALVPLGFVAYLALNEYVTGDALAFTSIQQEHWFKKLTPPWRGMHDVWGRTLGVNPIEGLHEFFFVVLTLLCAVCCWIWLRPSYALWVTMNWLLVTSTNFVLSVPRYSLAMFPIFILAARASRGRPLVLAAISIWSLLYLALYAGRFARGLWAF